MKAVDEEVKEKVESLAAIISYLSLGGSRGCV